MSTWAELKVGDAARVVTLRATTSEYRAQLLAWGLLPGTTFTVLGFSPCKDLVAILVRGSSLAVRLSEAKQIVIEKSSLP